MVNNSTADVFLLLGVEGGSSINKGSGELIATQLKQIMHDVEETITSHLKIKLDKDALDDLKEQINVTVTEALTSIKNTPVELTFSFNPSSIDKAMRDVKARMKQENIISPPKQRERKQKDTSGTGNTGSGTTENIKREAEETADIINQVIGKAIENVNARFGDSGAKIVERLEAFKAMEKRAFSTDEVNLFAKALNFSNEQGQLLGVIALFERINNTIQDTTVTAQALQTILAKTYIHKNIPTTLDPYKDSGINTIKNYLSSRHVARSKLVGYSIREDLLQSYLDKNEIKISDLGNGKHQDVNAFMHALSENYPDILQYESKENELAKLTVKSFEDIDRYAKEQTVQMQQANAEAEKYKQTFEEIVNVFELDKDQWQNVTLSLDQLKDIAARFPEIQPYIQKYIDDIESRLRDDVPKSVQEINNALSSIGEDAKPAFDSIGQGINDVTEAGKEAAEAINDVVNPTGSNENDIIRDNTDAINDETDATEEDTEAQKELNEEIEKGLTLRERSVRLSSSLSETPNSKTFTTTSRGLETGRIYTDTSKTTINKDGEEETVLSYKFNNAQVNSALDAANTKVAAFKKSLNSLYEVGNKPMPIKKRIEDVQNLIVAISKATNSGYFGDLEKLGFSTVKEAQDVLQIKLKEISSQISDNKKLIADNAREWERNAESVEKLREKLVDVDRDYQKLAEADTSDIVSYTRERISKTIEFAYQLADALKSVASEGDYDALFGLGIGSFEEGYSTLQTILKDTPDKLKETSKVLADNAREWERNKELVKGINKDIDDVISNYNKLEESDNNGLVTSLEQEIKDAQSLAMWLEKAAEAGDEQILFDQDYGTFSQTYELLKQLLQQINDQISDNKKLIADTEAGWNKVTAAVGRVVAVQKEWNNVIGSEYGKQALADDKIQKQIDDINELINVIDKFKKLQSPEEKAAFDWSAETSGLTTFEGGITNIATAMEAVDTGIIKVSADVKKFKDEAGNIEFSAIQGQMQTLRKVMDEFDKAPNVKDDSRFTYYREQASKLYETYREYQQALDAKDDAAAGKALTKLKNQYAATTTVINNLTNGTKKLNQEHRTELNVVTQRNKLYQEALNYYKKYESGIKANITLNKQWLDLMRQINSGYFGGDDSAAREALSKLMTTTKEAKAETMSLWGTLKKLFTDHFGSVSATALIGTLRNTMQKAYQNVLDIDKAMTELRKVTDLTERQYESFMNTAADLAVKVGGTIADTISSVSDFARLGFDVEQSTALAEAALVYKNVGDGLSDINEASESIISTIKAFSDIDAKDALSIIDKFNEVGNNYAITSAGIGTSLQKSAAALAAANNSLDESIALITAGNSVVQNPEVIGTTAKTISMFLRAAKTEAEEAGIETEGMVESVSKLREEILSLSKVDIMLDDKNYKSTYQILKEISEVWEDISDVSQANILEKLGGKRNANVVASIIENFDVAEQALQTSLNSVGSASKENEKYLNSIEGHINRLNVAYENLSKSILNSDLVKGGIDFLTNLTSGLNDFVNLFGEIPTLAAAASGALSAFQDVGFFRRDDVKRVWDLIRSGDFNSFSDIKNKFSKNVISRTTDAELHSLIDGFKLLQEQGNLTGQSIENLVNDARNLGGAGLADVFTGWAKTGKDARTSIEQCYAAIFDGDTKGIKNVSEIIKTFNETVTTPEGQLAFADEIAKTNTNLGEYLKNEKLGEASNFKYTKSLVAAKVETVALTAATSLLNAALSFGISIALQTVIGLFEDAINALDNALDKVESAQDQIKTSQDKLKSINDELKTTQTRLNELQKIKTPTLFEQDEINRLTKYNDELLRQQKIEERRLLIAKQEARTEAKNAWNSMTNVPWTAFFTGGVPEALTYLSNYFQGKDMYSNTQALERYRVLLEHIKDEEEEYIKAGKEETEGSRLAVMREEAEALNAQLTEYVNNLEIIRSGLDPKLDKDIIKVIDDIINSYKELTEGNKSKTFTDIWESADFTSVTNQLKKLAAEGKLTEETFSRVAGIQDFIAALAGIEKEEDAIKISDPSNIIKAIKQWVEDSGNAAEVASYQLSDYAKQLAAIKDTLDDASSQRSTIQSFYSKIKDGESLSTDDIEKLREYPELFSQLRQTTDGWTISAEALSNAYAKVSQEAYNAIRKARAETVAKRATQIDKFDSINTNVNSAYDYREMEKQRADIRDEINKSNEAIKSFDVLLKIYSGTLQGAYRASYDYADAVKNLTSNTSAGVSAQKEMNEDAKISIDTFSSLTSLGEEYLQCISFVNGEIVFSAEKFKELEKAKIADEIATIELTKAEIIYQRNQADMYGNRARVNELNQLLSDIEAKERALEIYADSYDEMWTKLLTDSKSGTSELDKQYQKELNKLKDANKGTIEDEEQFVNDWIELNKRMYEAVDADKYEENFREITEYIKGLDSLLDTYLEKWGRVNDYDENNISSRKAYLAESQRVNYDTYGDKNSTFYNLDTYEANLIEQAKYEADTLKIQSERGLSSYEDYMVGIRDIRNRYKDRDGNYLLDMSFVSGYEDLDKQYDKQLEELQKANDKTIDKEQSFVTEWKSLNKSLYEDFDKTKYEENLKEIAEYEKSLLDREFEEGYIFADEYRNLTINLWKNYKDILGKEVRTDWLKDTINNTKAELDKAYEDGEISAKKYFKQIDQLWSKNKNILGKTTQEEWLRDALGKEKDDLDKLYDKGYLSIQEYFTEVKRIWENNSDLLGNTTREEWISGAVDKVKDELDKAYDEGTLSAKKYFDDVKQLWEDNKDILGLKTQEEWLKDAWDKRASQEKTYWEQQKDLAEKYYDAEIKKISDVQDKEEKLNKTQELRLNLIKARQKLEEAKSQKTQLVFHDGMFEYMADQEAVLSAEEDVASAIEAIRENELQEQIDLLNEQKDEALLFYSDLIGMLDAYINDTKQIESSDPETINHVANSEEGQYYLKLLRGEISIDEIKDEIKNIVSKDGDSKKDTADTFVKQADTATSAMEVTEDTASKESTLLNAFDKVYGIVSGITALGTQGIFKSVLGLMSFVSDSDTIGLDNSYIQEATTSAINNVYNNSNIANDNSVNVGDIHMTIQGGTSQEMLNEFASKLSSAITAIAPKALV